MEFSIGFGIGFVVGIGGLIMLVALYGGDDSQAKELLAEQAENARLREYKDALKVELEAVRAELNAANEAAAEQLGEHSIASSYLTAAVKDRDEWEARARSAELNAAEADRKCQAYMAGFYDRDKAIAFVAEAFESEFGPFLPKRTA